MLTRKLRILLSVITGGVVLTSLLIIGPYLTNSRPSLASEISNSQAVSNGKLDSSKPLTTNQSLNDILREKGIASPDKIVIDKSDHTLALFAGNTWLKSYHVDFGEGGYGDKERAGDRKTPEGNFYVTEKSVLTPSDKYLGSRWMRLSYPNIEDAQRGLKQGIIDQQTYDAIVAAVNSGQTPPQRTALGGGIGIHGGEAPEFSDNWTWGCIGLTNGDVEDFFDYISVGTQVTIRK